uniref:Zinc finger protein 385C n=1 Tax=Buteo japonicus TaxID=224669 RepID=A0A8C0AWY8_9AVES
VGVLAGAAHSPLLASLPIPGRPLHPPLDIKHFLTFRLNGTSPLNLFPNFNTVTPSPLARRPFVSGFEIKRNQAEAHYKGHKHARRLKAIEAMKNKQKAAGAAAVAPGQLMSLGEPGPPASLQLRGGSGGCFPCDLLSLGDVLHSCRRGSNPCPCPDEGSHIPRALPPRRDGAGRSQFPAPSRGSAGAHPGFCAEPGCHKPQIKAVTGETLGKEGKKSKQHLYCPTCKVTVNSLSQLEAHNTGAKHKSMLEGHSTQIRRGRGKLLSRAGHKSKRIGNKGSINIQNKAFHCQVCEIYVNSETQLKQHMSSRRHKDRLAGKPPKPKYSPYNKLQKNAALAVSILKSKLALQKHLTKTLATRFLPSPLTAAAVCAMPGPLALRPAAATTLFQAPILGPALFRTPPAHVRTTPGPIVFAPY